MPAPPLDHALTNAVRFLLDRQSPDGAWRSDTYGVFKAGDALTPLVVNALDAVGGPGVADSVRRGADYLAAMARPDGTIDGGPFGLVYPVYTAALTVPALGRCGTRDTWLSFLLRHQLTEALGWNITDREYGGWGYAHSPPHKPPPGETGDPLAQPNLSATVFALEALGGANGDAAMALPFICRCQNFADNPTECDPAFDDGGFFFILGDPSRNKAGAAGTDRHGRERHCSYGSTTADGLRALLASGVPRDGERVTAARRWLVENFSPAQHPGQFGPGRQALQASVYYYYCWSATRAFEALGVNEIPWAESLADELQRRQRGDGSWVNDAVEVREDDPVVATSLAAWALAVCRGSLPR